MAGTLTVVTCRGKRSQENMSLTFRDMLTWTQRFWKKKSVSNEMVNLHHFYKYANLLLFFFFCFLKRTKENCKSNTGQVLLETSDIAKKLLPYILRKMRLKLNLLLHITKLLTMDRLDAKKITTRKLTKKLNFERIHF